MNIFSLILSCLLCLSSLALGETADVNQLCHRLLGERASDFSFEKKSTTNGQDVFSITAKGGNVKISANSELTLASGLHWYLKHVAHCQVSWNGDQLNLPATLPDAKITRTSPYKHGFYFNYCTFSYSMVWWDWARWEREIDYMALCGIDMPLAITGSEALWLNFLKRFGYSDTQAKAFICGPAYNA